MFNTYWFSWQLMSQNSLSEGPCFVNIQVFSTFEGEEVKTKRLFLAFYVEGFLDQIIWLLMINGII